MDMLFNIIIVVLLQSDEGASFAPAFAVAAVLAGFAAFLITLPFERRCAN